MAGHTKGPWFTEYRANKRGGYSQEVFDSEGEVVATAAWFPVSLNDTTTTTNREANARLIAAAPELLEALVLCFGEPGLCITDGTIANARAVITKATQP